MGNKILRQKLKGPAMASYYPRKVMTFRDFQREFKPLELEIENEPELERLEHIAACVVPCHGRPVHPSNILQSESSWEGSAEEEEGSRYVALSCVHASSTMLTTHRLRPQEEISGRAIDPCMRCDMYHYCIEEGKNIPDMTTHRCWLVTSLLERASVEGRQTHDWQFHQFGKLGRITGRCLL
jgi:hypothetical protein